MRMNVGSNERYVRLGLGAVALGAMPFVRSRLARALLGAVATSGLSTGLTRYCPVNQAFGRGFGVDSISLHRLREKFSSTPRRVGQENMLH